MKSQWNPKKYTPPKLAPEEITRLVAWRDDLKSGRYVQVDNALRDKITVEGKKTEIWGYCCLGVACLTAKRLGYKGRWVDGGNHFQLSLTPEEKAEGEYVNESLFKGEGALPTRLGRWFGLKQGSDDPVLIDPKSGADDCASVWNDTQGKNFDEIADMVTFTFGLPPYVPAKGWDEA